MHNLLATRRGRLAAFFLLYVTEGIPIGFAATAVVTQLRRGGVGPAEIGAFAGAFLLPWTFKWAYGPFVDVFRSKRFGHRRAWIFCMQVMMAVTMLALIAVPLPQGLGLFTAILLVHNIFGAIQDVAIDSLAINTLAEHERGLGNGLMLAGSSIGQVVGGAGVLLVVAHTGFQWGYVLVAASILAVTAFVVVPMKETVPLVPAPAEGSGRLRAAGAGMRKFAAQSFQAFMGTRGAFGAVFFSLLPAGAMSLAFTLQATLCVEFGMTNEAIASMNFWTTVAAAISIVVGGWVSDRIGRRRTLAVYLACMSLPVFYLAWTMQVDQYILPRAPGGAAMPHLIEALWIATTAYAVALGLMNGARLALLMDMTNPRVAATQFAAYTALINLSVVFAAGWQGIAAQAWGYPVTLLIDAITGLLCIALLPAMKRPGTFNDARAGKRARATAQVLGIACLSWLLYWPNREALGAAQPILGSLYSLVFIASALFLLAGREVLAGEAGRWRRAALWAAVFLLAMYLRYWLDKLGGVPLLHAGAELLIDLVPFAGGMVLLGLSTFNWNAADAVEASDQFSGQDSDTTGRAAQPA